MRMSDNEHPRQFLKFILIETNVGRLINCETGDLKKPRTKNWWMNAKDSDEGKSLSKQRLQVGC